MATFWVLMKNGIEMLPLSDIELEIERVDYLTVFLLVLIGFSVPQVSLYQRLVLFHT